MLWTTPPNTRPSTQRHNPETDPTFARSHTFRIYAVGNQGHTTDSAERTVDFDIDPTLPTPAPSMTRGESADEVVVTCKPIKGAIGYAYKSTTRRNGPKSEPRRIENHQERIRSGSEKHLYHIRQGPTARFGGFGGAYAPVPADRHFGGRMGKDFRRKPCTNSKSRNPASIPLRSPARPRTTSPS